MAIVETFGSRYHSVAASRVAMLAHVLFLTTAILMLVWLLHFRGGINIQSDDPEQVFNVHPFVMCWGFILLIGEAILAYSSIHMMDHRTQKMAHMLIHLVALILGSFGVYAAFKYHDVAVVPDLVSLHSWLGISTISLFGLQWLFGFFVFWLPGANERTRAAAAPMHVIAGIAIFLLAVCSAQTGLVEKSAAAASSGEAKLINATGIFILLYGVTVTSSVALRKAFL